MSSRRVVWAGALLGTFVLAFGALGVAGAKKKTKTKTFSSGSLSAPIVDDTDATLGRVNVGKRGKVKDVNVSLRLDHSDLGDLDIYLLSPGGRTAHLWDNRDDDFNDNSFVNDEDFGSGSNSCGGSKTTFDDEAVDDLNDLAEDTDGHVGSFRPPDASLSAFDGSKMKGAWYLVVIDNEGSDDGTLGCVDLRIKYKKTKK